MCKVTLIFVNAFADGILVIPFLIAILSVFLSEILNLSHRKRFMIWRYQVKILRIFNFMALFFILVCNSHYIQYKIDDRTKTMLGDVEIRNATDIIRVMFLFLLQALLSYHDDQIDGYIKKSSIPQDTELSMEKFIRRSGNFDESWYIRIFSIFLRLITTYSYKIIQIMLILWGLSRVSIILFCFVTVGIIGVQVSDKFFAKYMLRSLLHLGFFFVSFQTVYNLSTEDSFWNTDKYINPATLRMIGFYKYKNMHMGETGGIYISMKEAEYMRAAGICLDLLSYYFWMIAAMLLYLRDFQKKQDLRQNSTTNKSQLKMIVNVNKLIKKFKHFWSQQSFKLCVTMMLFASILVKIDLIHLVYLIFFMFLMGLSIDKEKKHRVFYAIIIYSGSVILGLYFYQVLHRYISEDLEKFIGITHSKSNLVYLYKEHVMIFFTYLLSYKERKTFKDKLAEDSEDSDAGQESILQLHNSHLSNNSDLSEIEEKKKKYSIDHIKLFIVKNIVWIHYATVVFVIFLPPMNLFSFVYLNWLFVLIGVFVITPDTLLDSKWVVILTSLLSVYSATILLLRYLTQISSTFIKGYLKATTLFSEDDFGLSKQYATYTLFGNSLLFLLFTFHRKTIIKGKMRKIMVILDENLKRRVPIPKTVDYYRYSIIVWYMQLKHLLYPYIFVLIVFTSSIILSNMIGMIYFILLVIGILKEKNRNWKNMWIAPFIVSVVVMTLQYLINCCDTFRENKFRYLFQWIGLEFEGEGLIKNYAIFLIIMTYCIFFSSRGSGGHLIMNKAQLDSLMKDKFYEFIINKDLYVAYTIYRCYNSFNIYEEEEKKKTKNLNNINDELIHAKEKLRLLKNSLEQDVYGDENVLADYKEEIDESNTRIIHLENQKKNIEEHFVSDISQNVDFKRKHELVKSKEPLIRKKLADLDMYTLSRPRIKGNLIYQRITKTLDFFIIELGIFFLTIALFFDGTVLSLIFFAMAVYFSRKVHRFYKTFKNTRENRALKNSNRKELRRYYIQWKIAIVFLTLMMVVKYFMMIWLPSVWNGKYPFDRLEFGCDQRYSNTFSDIPYFKKQSDYFKCVFEWKKWALLYSRNNFEIIWYFVAFFIMVMSLDTQRKLILGTVLDHVEKEVLEEKNFTLAKNRKNIADFFKFMFFGYLSSFSLFVFFVIGIVGNSSNLAGDTISIVYMTLGVFHLLKGTIYDKSKKKRLWWRLEYFNIFVMFLQICFQIPYFGCPVIVNRDRYFFSTQECTATYNSGKPIFVFKEAKSTLEIVYAIVVNTIGLEKIYGYPIIRHSKALFMIFFFLLAMLQRHIWDHRYTTKYVETYFKQMTSTSTRRALSFIKHFYEEKIWRYFSIRTEYDVLRRRQNRIDNKMRKWKELFKMKDASIYDAEEEERRILIQDRVEKDEEAPIDKIKESRQEKAEMIALAGKGLAYVTLEEIEMILEKNDEDIRKANEEVNKMRDKLSQQLHDSMYLVKGLNILKLENNINDKTLQRLKTTQVMHDTLQQIIHLTFQQKKKRTGGFASDMEPQSKLGQKVKGKLQKILEMGKKESLLAENSANMLRIRRPITMGALPEIRELSKEELVPSPTQTHPREPAEGDVNLFGDGVTSKRTIEDVDDNPLQISKAPSLIYQEYEDDEIIYEISEQKKSIWVEIKRSMLSKVHLSLRYENSKVILTDKSTFFSISEAFIRSYTIFLVALFFVINHLLYANALSLILPLSLLLYGLLENPFPPKFFWLTMANYLFVIIFLKMIYQLPLFCGDPAYTLVFSEQCQLDDVSPGSFYKRWDLIIGIRKFNGNASYPRDEGIFHGLIYDYLALVSILIHRSCCENIGLWDHVTLGSDRRLFPQLRREAMLELVRYNLKGDMMKTTTIGGRSIHQQRSIQDLHQSRISSNNNIGGGEDIYDEREDRELAQTINEKIIQLQRTFNSVLRGVVNFWYRLFPYYLDYQEEEGECPIQKYQYEPLFIKPGQDLYTLSFVMELMILVFFILSYSNMNGTSISFKEGLTRSRFSGGLVIVIIIFIGLICMNRICFKLKYSTLDHSSLAKEQDKFAKFEEGGIKYELLDAKAKNKLEEERKIFKRKQSDRKMKKHALTGRFFIYITTVIVIHYYLFFLVPKYNKKPFNEIITAKVCYLLFIAYFFISARQISFGYADSLKIQAFTDQFNAFGKMGIRIFKGIPFLYEIKNVIDWSITTTALDLFQWFKMEDAYLTLFLAKSEMEYRKNNKGFGDKVPFFDKLTFGWCFLIGLIFILIFPMLLFSTLNPNYIPNNPIGGEVGLKLWAQLSEKNIKEFYLFKVNQLKVLNLSDKEVFLQN